MSIVRDGTLKECSWSRAYWFASLLGVRMDLLVASSILDWFKTFSTASSLDQFAIFITLCWNLWRCRCDALFESQQREVAIS